MTRTFTAPDDSTVEVQGVHNCCACNTLKPATEFYKDSGRWTGISSRCKTCSKARLAASSALTMAKSLQKLAEGSPVVRDLIRTTARQLAAA